MIFCDSHFPEPGFAALLGLGRGFFPDAAAPRLSKMPPIASNNASSRWIIPVGPLPFRWSYLPLTKNYHLVEYAILNDLKQLGSRALE
jgi:hypothetical protein